jgi:hypothetical protein
MKSRRQFVRQGAMAATVLLAAKPFTIFGNMTSTFTGLTSSGGKLVFLHTAGLDPATHSSAIEYIAAIKNSVPSAILLKADKNTTADSSRLRYDTLEETADYSIINKGGIRTGIIKAVPGDIDVIQKTNLLAGKLKTDKNCQAVVCLSQLGYKNNLGPDDITLAEKSSHLDIIIGGHPDNFYPKPITARNKDRAEVIIHAAAGNPFAFGKIEMEFDEQGRKKSVGVIHKIPKQAAAANA